MMLRMIIHGLPDTLSSTPWKWHFKREKKISPMRQPNIFHSSMRLRFLRLSGERCQRAADPSPSSSTRTNLMSWQCSRESIWYASSLVRTGKASSPFSMPSPSVFYAHDRYGGGSNQKAFVPPFALETMGVGNDSLCLYMGILMHRR